MLAYAFSLISQLDFSALETQRLHFCFSTFKNVQDVKLQSNWLAFKVEGEAYTSQCCTLNLEARRLTWLTHFTVRCWPFQWQQRSSSWLRDASWEALQLLDTGFNSKFWRISFWSWLSDFQKFHFTLRSFCCSRADTQCDTSHRKWGSTCQRTMFTLSGMSPLMWSLC